MKRVLAWVILLVLLLKVTAVCAETTMSVSDKGYALEVRSVDMRTSTNGKYRVLKTVQTTGVKEDAKEITLEYDYEEQKKEFIGKFRENAPMALVTVHGWDDRLAALEAEEVVLTVNGLPVETEERTDLQGHVGWEKVLYDGANSVVFPIELTKQGGECEFAVRVQGIAQDVRITETAQITVKLVNTHAYKEEKPCRILDVECADADAYIVGDALYVDHPVGKARDVKIRLTFADENGDKFKCITWAEGTVCAAENLQAALHPETAVKLDRDGKAEYVLESGCAQERREKVRFVLETEGALYRTQEYAIVERFDVEKEDPKGIRFAQAERILRVGDVFEPAVLAVGTDEVLRSGAFGKLRIAAGENTDAQVIDVSDGVRVIAVRPGTAYITARYETGLAAYDAASMKILVTDEEMEECTVLCRRLNVRAGAGTEQEIVGRLHRGETVRVTAVENGWVQLANGGWVCARYIG